MKSLSENTGPLPVSTPSDHPTETGSGPAPYYDQVRLNLQHVSLNNEKFETLVGERL
jgi:hypothetical protein